ncbi:MAG TPA: hypothetical protein VM077_04295 [Candidatus Limnocylindrales bacterium]|nr:hypothetical protein [Candidatus Limnocylindrales bacterium]
MGAKSKKMDQKGNVNLIAIAVLVLGITAAVFLVVNRTNLFSNASKSTQYKYEQKTIQNSNDLMNASDELDNTDLDSVDAELDQNDADSVEF